MTRGDEANASTLLLGPPPGSHPNQRVPEIRAKLRAATYEVELIGESQLRWKQCWNELTHDLKRWLKDNAQVLAGPSR